MEKISKTLLSWASIADDATLDQAAKTASMPFVHPHVALMPDAHLGKGATVGSVIPTLRSIIPAAVGVDIGCVDADTEYLSPQGWRRIADYAQHGGQVAQFHPETGLASFVEPLRYVERPQETFLRFTTKHGIDQMLTPDHRVLCWRSEGRERRQVQQVVTAARFAAEHDRLALGNEALFETSFRLVAGPADARLGIALDEAALRVQVMFHADGHLVGRRGVLHLTEQRKIERARKLLDVAGLDYTEIRNSDTTTTIRFTPPMTTKTYADLPWPTQDQAEIIAEECLRWDGTEADRVFFTRLGLDADYIQYVFAATGHRASLRADRNDDGSVDYRVFAMTSSRTAMAGTPKSPITEVPSADGLAYCFTVPSGFLVLRRGGNIFTTGNCGMDAVRTPLTRADLPDDLAPLRRAIAGAVPLSAGKYNAELTESAAARVADLEARAEKARFDPADHAGNWRLQLGSLGSGNHFIEVSVDEADRVWLFLHSGSRGVGNKIALHHVKVAAQLCERWWITLPDRDLAYLVEGTDEFWSYIRQLTWAQEFARLNRAEMMDRSVDALAAFVGHDVERAQEISCHHNYTAREKHFGREVWLSRKGAIDASAGTPGLIPGSMGAASYVVSGLGNPVALDSAPHGAGRMFSRSAARKRFTQADLRTRMAGIEWDSASEAFLDEHPDAYKPIDQVMADAADLVEVRHTLRQVVNVKGD